MSRRITVGSRGSKLALMQAESVVARVVGQFENHGALQGLDNVW